MSKITEIAPDLFCITTFVELFLIQFSQFLVGNEQPLLFYTGPQAPFQEVISVVASLIDPITMHSVM